MDAPFSWIRHVYLAMRKAMDEELSPYGITFAQLEVIACLYHQDGLEHRQLLTLIGTTSATMSSTIDGLVNLGFVERRLSAEDARVKHIFFTEQGRQLAPHVCEIFVAFQQRVLQGFSSAETRLLREWLAQIGENLNRPFGKPL